MSEVYFHKPNGIAGKTLAEWREFARRDDCLDRMVPSDLRMIIAAITPTDAQVMANEKVRKLVEALEKIAGDAESHQSFYDRNGPQWTSPHGNEYEDTSAFLNSHNELASIARAALRDLEAGSD